MAEERRRKHFIAVLGTGNYKPCTYFFGEQDCDTRFVQEAVLKLACGELCTGDRITICLTDEAREKNWGDHGASSGEICKGLHSVLETWLGDMPDIKIEGKDIATGKDSKEIADMFSGIYDVIGENEEIYFDITHGLRNIPMLVMTILEYAKVTRNISIGGIFYGAFEVGEGERGTENWRVPIFDLSYYHTILNWSVAANSFIEYGHADEVYNLSKDNWSQISQTAVKGQDLKALSGNLNNVANHLQEFTSSIETGRGNIAYKESIRKKYEKYVKAEQAIVPGDLVAEYYPFRELLDKIENKMERYKDAETNLKTGVATVEWCIDHHMVQQGYTALEETTKTFLCEKIEVPQDKRFWRETVVKRLCSSFYEVVNKERGEIDRRYAEWKEFLRKEEIDDKLRQEGLAKGEKLFKLLFENEGHMNLIRLMNQIGDRRNDINHFGFTDKKATAETLKKELKNLMGTFKKIQEDWA